MRYRSVCATIYLAAAASSYGAVPKHRIIASTSHAASKSRGTSNWRAANGTEAARAATVARADKQVNAQQADRTWTNDRLERLHDRGLISVFNQLPEARAEAAPQAASEESDLSLEYDRAKDARWYAEQVATLRAVIQALETELVQYRAEIEHVRALKTMEAGLAVYQDTIGITPEAGIEVRKTLLQNVRSQLDELSDLARHNNILPGIVRE